MENSQEAAETHVAYEIPKSLAEQRQDDFSKAIWGTSTPFRRETIQEEVGASPVDIARAYMVGQTLELGRASRSRTENDKPAVQRRRDFPSMPIITTPSKSIRWPGAVVEDNRGYLTPQNQKTKFELQNFPRTPYSRTIYSKSKSKISYLHSYRYKNVSSLRRSQTLNYQQMNTRSDSLDDGYGSIGPIRSSRQNIAAESPYRGSDSLQKSGKQISHVENADVSGRETPLFKMREPGSASRTLMSWSRDSNPRGFDLGVGVHPQSSQIARRILDQIDRKVPTVQEKAAELRIANSWKEPISSGVSATMPIENVRSALALSNGVGFYKNSSANDQVHSSQKTGDEGIPPRVSDSAQSNYAAEANHTGSDFANHDNDGPSLLFGKTSVSRTTAANEKASDDHQQRSEYALWTGYSKANGLDISETVSGRSATDALGFRKKQQSQPFGNKPVLASLSVDRQQPKCIALSGNNSSTGFTFPVTNSGVLSQPPTPSVMPSSSASVSKESTELADDVPTYTFGSKRSSPALVFSFPSSSEASTQADDSEISFTFSSDTKNRISISSVHKNAVCY